MPVVSLAFLARLGSVERQVTGVLLVFLVPRGTRALLEQTAFQVTKESWVPLVPLAKKESQEKEENLVQKVSKDLMGQLEHQGSQDIQDPWVTKGRGVSLASRENLDLLAKRPVNNTSENSVGK